MEKFIHTTADCIDIIENSLIKWKNELDEFEKKLESEGKLENDEVMMMNQYKIDIVKWQEVFDILTEISEKKPEFNVVDVYNSKAACSFNDEKKSFFDFILEDITVDYMSMPFIKLDVAV